MASFPTWQGPRCPALVCASAPLSPGPPSLSCDARLPAAPLLLLQLRGGAARPASASRPATSEAAAHLAAASGPRGLGWGRALIDAALPLRVDMYSQGVM